MKKQLLVPTAGAGALPDSTMVSLGGSKRKTRRTQQHISCQSLKSPGSCLCSCPQIPFSR